MKKSLTSFGVLALGLALLGAGCTTADCVVETDWGSCITDTQADTGLLGTWTLVSQQVVAPAGTIENPFNGRTLTFTENGTFNGFSEDWSPEFVDNAIFTPDNDVFVSECDTIGTGGGAWAVVPAGKQMELRIVPSGNNVQVTCSADGDVEVTTNAASTPLGVGPAIDATTGALATPAATDAYVPYAYAISEDGNLLQIIQTIPASETDQGADVQNVFVFQR